MMWVIACTSLFFAAIPALLYFRNVRLYRSPTPDLHHQISVSVLIPARNEETAIDAAVRSVLTSQNRQLEVIVLDDHSEDRTAEIVREISQQDSRVRLESAPALPPGWCGKQHACHVLAGHASYELFVFMDADVRLTSDGLDRMCAFQKSSGADLISGIPRQITGTILEKLAIPLIHFLLLGFLPIYRMRLSRDASFGAGCGQLFMATRKGYLASGGHASIKQSLHDGLTLPRSFRKAGLMTDLFDATETATCRMYRSASQVWYGLAKNAREGLASNRLIVLATILLLSGQVLPFVLLITISLDQPLSSAIILSACLCAVAPRFDAMLRFRQSVWGAILHPIGVLIVVSIQWFALLRDLLGLRPSWKGRSVVSSPP